MSDFEPRIAYLEGATEDLAITLSEIESKLTCMQQQLVSINLKVNESRRELRLDMYLAAVLLGAVSFLLLKAIP